MRRIPRHEFSIPSQIHVAAPPLATTFPRALRSGKSHNANVDAPIYTAHQWILKKMENHEHALSLYFMYYNFARIPPIAARHAHDGSGNF